MISRHSGELAAKSFSVASTVTYDFFRVETAFSRHWSANGLAEINLLSSCVLEERTGKLQSLADRLSGR